MSRGYLKVWPFAAFTLAIIIHMILSVPSNIMIGIPMIMKQSGIARMIYSSIDNWKLRDDLPFSFTQADSSLLESQQIRGPIIAPNGKKKPENADR